MTILNFSDRAIIKGDILKNVNQSLKLYFFQNRPLIYSQVGDVGKSIILGEK